MQVTDSDGSFVLVEDDGREALDYESSNIKTTSLSWKDSTKTLSWTVGGTFEGDSHSFTQLYVTMFEVVKDSSGKTTVKSTKSDVKIFGKGGSINF